MLEKINATNDKAIGRAKGTPINLIKGIVIKLDNEKLVSIIELRTNSKPIAKKIDKTMETITTTKFSLK